MSVRFIALVIAAVGWLIAALLAYVMLYWFGFFGVGFIGLLMLFICSQVELESGAGSGLSGAQTWKKQAMSHAERASQRHEYLLGIGSTRFVRYVGIALTLIGFGGFLYFQLD